MRIAIIEKDDKFIYYLKKVLASSGSKEWQILFFKDTIDFGKMEIKVFNTIMVSYDLDTMECTEFLRAVKDKTGADLYLVCNPSDCVANIELSHQYIKGIIRKNPNAIIHKLKYLETKYRIKQMIAAENENINNVVVKANGYSFDVNEDIAFIKIKRTLSEESKGGLIKKFYQSNINKAVISYPDRGYVEMSHCRQIFDIYKAVFENGGKMAFCNLNNNRVDVLRKCKIDEIIPIFDNKEKAVSFLHTQNKQF